MKYRVKIASEITIKSKPVRKQCIKMLAKNIRIHLHRFEGFFEVNFFWDRIDIDVADLGDLQRDIQNILKNIPGIAYFVEVEKFDLGDMALQDSQTIFQNISKIICDFYSERVSGKTFVVRVNRVGAHDFSSIDVERYVGGSLLEYASDASVRLKNPDIKVEIDIRGDVFYIVKNTIKGIGGYPVGFQERVVSLISGGFDSGVSTFSMMKRGCLVDYLFFNLGGSAHELGVKQVAYHLWEKFSLPHRRARFVTVPFEDVVTELSTKVHHKYRGIVLKRLMLQMASMIAENNYYALVKGDSLGQVSSQTLKNIHIIDKAASTLVLRPLIGCNKQEIVDISQEIGTYDFACNMPEYCGVISEKPSTGARIERVLEEEGNISSDLLERIFQNLKVQFVKDIIGEYTQNISSDIDIVFELGNNEVVVDIREESEKKKFPLLGIEKTHIVEIPFFEIKHRFQDLDQNKTYLFYCKNGVLSRLYGLYLREKGFQNIKIFKKK